MATTTTLNIVTADGLNPVVSDAPEVTVTNLINLLHSMVGGAQTSSATLAVGTAAASATATLVTPVVGNVLTLNGVAVTATQHNSRGTATFSTIVADNTVTVNGVTFTAKASPAAGSYTEFALGASDTEAATNLAAKVNAHPTLVGTVTALGAAAVVKFRAVTGGTAGDAITLAKVGSPISLSGATLASGAAVANNQWDQGDTDTQAATALAAAVNASSSALISGHFSATSAAGVVTVTAKVKGLAGNALAVAKTGAPITLGGVTSGLATGGTATTLSF